MASVSWFYSDGGKSFGPVAEDVIQNLVTDGTIGREHFVMEEGNEDWEKVSESQFAPLLEQIWYYSDTAETFGPFSEAALRELVESGTVGQDHFVMRASETDWVALEESKFSTIKIKGPKPLSGPVSPTPMRRVQPAPPPRPKAEIRTDGHDQEAPSAPRKKSTQRIGKAAKSAATVPAAETPPTDKLAKLSKELASTKRESEEWMRRVAEAEKERGDALKESADLAKKLADFEGELLQINKQFDRSETVAMKAKSEIAGLREDLEVARKKIGEHNAAREAQSKRIAELESGLAEAEDPKAPRAGGAGGGRDAAKVKRLSAELLETSALLAKAKERAPAQEKRIRELEDELSKASAKLADSKAPVSELSERLKELESQLENAGEPGAANRELVRTWETKFAKAKSDAEIARAESAKAKRELEAAEERAKAAKPAVKSSKLAWAAAFVGILAAAGASWFAWSEFQRANDLDSQLSGARALEAKLAASERDLADTKETLAAAQVAADTGKHSDFTAQLLDRIAAISGPIDPDLIAELRRETEDHFKLADNVGAIDAEDAERAAQMIADGDSAADAGNHDAARNFYRDASLLISPLLEKYPSKAFWRGDLITAYTRHAREELALEKPEAADTVLAKAEAHLETLRNEEPERAAIRTGELADVWGKVGESASRSGDIVRARAGLERALAFHASIDPDPKSATQRNLHTKLGAVAESAGQWTSAQSHYQKAIAADPGEAEKMLLLRDLAKVERKLGKLTDAGAKAEEYLAYHRTIAEKQPVPDNLRDFAKAMNLVGEIRRDSADYAGATAAHAGAESVLQNLIAADPADADTQRELAITSIRAGEVEMAQKNYAKARARFEENLPTFRLLVGKDPNDIEALRDLEYLHLNIARSHALENNHENALAAYADALRVSELLNAAAPKNVTFARNLADWKVRIGNYQKSLGKLIPARDNLREALRIFETFAAADETNLETKRQIAELNKALGDLEMKIAPEVAVTPEVIDDPTKPVGNPPGTPTPPIVRNEGEPYFRDAIATAKELVEKEPDDPAANRDLGIAHENLAAFLMTGSRFPEAIGEYQRCLAIRKKIVENSTSPEPLWIHELSRVYHDLAFLESQTGTIGIGEQYYISALNHGEAAVKAAVESKGGAPAEWIAHNGETYLRLGEIDQAERQLYQARRRFQRAVEILRILTASHDDQDGWKLNLVHAYAGLAANYENGEPKDPARARSLYADALDILDELNAEDKLSPSEQKWIGQLRKKAS